jgi:nitroimidazol reductase NimA-like FMN-containing flavoprotein (pyridoxamine 5'-phosphate oxidase superfamily)
MPGYGIAEASGGKGLLPWSWALERLNDAHNYFVATARPDGRPHVMPVWGVWLDDAFFFSTGTTSRKARNLATNAHCVVTTERADESVIVEGVAEEVEDEAALTRFKEVYHEKYDWEIDTSAGGIYAVRARVAFGFIEAADNFTKTATRWVFENA